MHPMSRPIRVQLVDDHEIVRSGFRHLLEKEGDFIVVAESSDGKQACRDFNSLKPELVIMDISLPDITGLEAMRRIRMTDADATILILSMHSGMVAKEAMRLGANGFVCKRSGADRLIEAIHAIMNGESFFDESCSDSAAASEDGTNETLSRRELEVCLMLAEGMSVREIADKLFISDKTVYTHRRRIMNKLGASSTHQLTRIASILNLAPDN